jgi:hypothetical protein
MRLVKAFSFALAGALLIPALPAAQGQQDADRKVAGGGVTAKGWQGKADPGNRQGLTVNDSKFATEGSGFRLTTGPAALYWNPANNMKGDYTVRATFTEPKQTYNHPHPFGVFIGGSSLDTDTPNALWCGAYRDGTFFVRGFLNGKPTTLAKKNAHEKVVKAAGPDAEVKQEVALTVKGDRVECLINGASVWSAAKSELSGLPTEGIAGIRTSHNSEAVVTGFSTK